MIPRDSAYLIDKADQIVDLMGSLFRADWGHAAAPKHTSSSWFGVRCQLASRSERNEIFKMRI